MTKQGISEQIVEYGQFLAPQEAFSQGKRGSYLRVFYITDIHIDTHLKKDSIPYERQIKTIVKDLFDDTFTKALARGWAERDRVIICFGGDASSNIEFCRIFYHTFMLRMQYLDYLNWKRRGSEELYDTEEEAKAAVEHTADVKRARLRRLEKRKRIMKDISPYLWDRYKKYIDDELSDLRSALFNIDCYKDSIISERVRKAYDKKEQPPVFAILGNHELSQYDTVKEAVEAYKEMFQKEGIIFLHNQLYDKENAYKDPNTLILGGVGFAKYNEKYNANTVPGAKKMSRSDECMESEAFYDNYKKALSLAKKRSIPLIVLSHYPTKDWLPDNDLDSCCYYFSGHTHRNLYISNDKYHVYANNQVGYHKKDIRLIDERLGLMRNPFLEYPDGAHIITTTDYRSFCNYSSDPIESTGLIDKQITEYNAKFYMIKNQGFYGFFVENPKTGVKICKGGRTKTIKGPRDIRYYEKNFARMVDVIIKALKPYRMLQEQLSKEIKSVGLSGNIHGCIIDADYFNHIMVNPIDGKITFYYSEVFGQVKEYATFRAMIKKIGGPQMVEKYDDINTPKKQMLIAQPQKKAMQTFNKTVRIDIKNSVYAYSRRVRQFQRLFETNVLREWNEELLREDVQSVPQITSVL